MRNNKDRDVINEEENKLKIYMTNLNSENIGKVILSSKYNTKKKFKYYFTEQGIYKVNYNSDKLFKLNIIDKKIEDNNYISIDTNNFIIDNSYIKEDNVTQLPIYFNKKYFIEEYYYIYENENKNRLKFIVLKEKYIDNENNEIKDKIIDYYFLYYGTYEELFNYTFNYDIRLFLSQFK
jgi:hypothetical protein